MIVPPLPAEPGTGVVVVGARPATVEDVIAVADGAPVVLDPSVVERIAASRRHIENLVRSGLSVYGLNTGLGPRRDQVVSERHLQDYQAQIIASHAGSLGAPVPHRRMRAALAVRVCGLATGWSGASPRLIEAVVALLNHDVIPIVPATGSVGASDLQLMAGVGRVLLGKGMVWFRGEVRSAADALAEAGITPHAFEPKDALALISANCSGLATAILVEVQARRVAALADLAAAVTMEVVGANLSPFDPRVFVARPFLEGGVVAARIRHHLSGGWLDNGSCTVAVQDALSIRVIPQVHGSVRRQLRELDSVLETELRSSGDNPLIDPLTGEAVSNGNFHPMEVTLAMEGARLGLAHVALIAERRIVKLVGRNRHLRTVEEEIAGSLSSLGFEVPPLIGNTAAALTGQIKHLALPVSLNVPPLGGDVEDHASFLPHAAAVTAEVVQRLEDILMIEIVLAIGTSCLEPARPWGAVTSQVREAVIGILDSETSDGSATNVIEGLRSWLAANTSVWRSVPEPGAQPEPQTQTRREAR